MPNASRPRGGPADRGGESPQPSSPRDSGWWRRRSAAAHRWRRVRRHAPRLREPRSLRITGVRPPRPNRRTASEPIGAVTGPPPLPAEPRRSDDRARHLPAPRRLRPGGCPDRCRPDLRDRGTGATGTSRSCASGEFVGGVGVYQPHGLAAGSGCSGDRLDTRPGQGRVRSRRGSSPDLPRSKVLQPLTRVRAFGHDASHVRLRIKDDCPAGQAYRVAETPRGSRGISYSDVPTTVTVDFWVVDLGTTSGRGRRLAPEWRVSRPGEPGRRGPRLDHLRAGASYADAVSRGPAPPWPPVVSATILAHARRRARRAGG